MVKYERFIMVKLCHSISLHTFISVTPTLVTKLVRLRVQLETKESGNSVATCDINVLTEKYHPLRLKEASTANAARIPLIWL